MPVRYRYFCRQNLSRRRSSFFRQARGSRHTGYEQDVHELSRLGKLSDRIQLEGPSLTR